MTSSRSRLPASGAGLRRALAAGIVMGAMAGPGVIGTLSAQSAPPAAPRAPETPAQAPAPATGVAPPPQMDEPTAEEDGAAGAVEAESNVAPEPPRDTTMVTGYVDVGYAKAEGNGTSFPANDFRLPADYGVDPFATAVNSRGDVASTDSGGRFVNGFLPRSAGIAGRGSFLLNVFNADLRYSSNDVPLFIFARVQMVPRLSPTGDNTLLFVDQAFGRLVPFSSAELAISLGKFDSVFGIEYLDNPSNIRVGITPSLMARYTTGTSVGAKFFYRKQLPLLWSAFSLNTSATNSGTMVESLQAPDASLTGRPVVAARLGYELNLPRLAIRLGVSGLEGPRNDQRDPGARQRMVGFDARLSFGGLALSAEYVHVDEEGGSAPKLTGLGTFTLASSFHARGFYAQAAYGFLLDFGALKRVTVYGRVEQRHAWFEGFTPLTVQRATGGLRIDLWDQLALKGELLLNRERTGSPEVPNNVITSSVVFTW